MVVVAGLVGVDVGAFKGKHGDLRQTCHLDPSSATESRASMPIMMPDSESNAPFRPQRLLENDAVLPRGKPGAFDPIACKGFKLLSTAVEQTAQALGSGDKIGLQIVRSPMFHTILSPFALRTNNSWNFARQEIPCDSCF